MQTLLSKITIFALILTMIFPLFCSCGKKAIVNARIDGEGKIVTDGDQVLIGGNDAYVAMCHSCWQNAIRAQKKKPN